MAGVRCEEGVRSGEGVGTALREVQRGWREIRRGGRYLRPVPRSGKEGRRATGEAGRREAAGRMGAGRNEAGLS